MPRSDHLARLIATACVAAACAQRDPAPRLDPLALRSHVEFLASDLLEGREAGSRGYDLAAAYVASQFQALGLEGAGDSGWMQYVPLRRSRLVPGSVSLQVGARRFTDADHVVAYPSEGEADQRLTAGAVFAGHGVVSREHRRDDYAGLDVRGKFVVLLGGPPAGLPEEEAAHVGSLEEQDARAAERGALGVLLIYTPALERRWPFVRMAPVTHQPRISWVDARAQTPDSTATRAVALLDSVAASALFAGADRSLAEVISKAASGPAKGFELPHTVTFTRRAMHERARSANVAALLPGSDPALRNEVVVVSSHLDHVGIGVPKDDDSIYNGAVDNAIGIAGTIEIARVLRAMPPRRSILFLAVTAEEKGLVGSDFFARFPTIPRDRMVGVINFDGGSPFQPFTAVMGIGAHSSTLGDAMVRVADAMRIDVVQDPNPGQSLFTRSDHYSFVKQGVPAVFILPGMDPGRTPLEVRYAAEHLHQPSDEVTLPIDWNHFAHYTEFFRRLIVDVANAAEAPRWREGDYFANRFAPSAPRAPASRAESERR